MKLSVNRRKRIWSQWLAVVLLAGAFGWAARPAYADEKNKSQVVSAQVEFRVEVGKVVGESQKRGFGKIWLSGAAAGGMRFDGAGDVFFTTAGGGLPLAGTQAVMVSNIVCDTHMSTGIVRSLREARARGRLENISVLGSGVTADSRPWFEGTATGNIVIDVIGAGFNKK